MGRGFLLIGLAIAAALALAAPSMAASPVKGARYDGRTNKNIRVFLQVNAAGTRLADYDLGGALSCSDGKRRSIGLFARGERPTSIDPAGSFSHTAKATRFTLREKLRTPVRGSIQTSFSGSFVSADSVSGSVTTSFRSPKVTCQGTSPFTLSRNGTPGAPFRDDTMASGTYRAGGRGIRVTALRTLAPGDELQRFRFRTTLRCRDGRSYGSTFNFDQYLLGVRSNGLFTGTSRFSLGSGFRARQRYRVTIAFRRSGGRYLVGGRVRARSVVTRGGRRQTTCSASRRFTGRFTGGPANLF